jgi:hypothetical protein
MTRETLERMTRDIAGEIPLPPDDWEAAVTAAIAMLTWVRSLDELPLQNVEPASVAGILPPGEEKS